MADRDEIVEALQRADATGRFLATAHKTKHAARDRGEVAPFHGLSMVEAVIVFYEEEIRPALAAADLLDEGSETECRTCGTEISGQCSECEQEEFDAAIREAWKRREAKAKRYILTPQPERKP